MCATGTDGWRAFSTPKTLIYTAPPEPALLPTVAKPEPPPPALEAYAKPALALAAAAAVGAIFALALTRGR